MFARSPRVDYQTWFPAAVLVSIPGVPVIAVLLILAIYAAPDPHDLVAAWIGDVLRVIKADPVLWGTVGGIASGVLYAWWRRQWTSARYANSSAYAALGSRESPISEARLSHHFAVSPTAPRRALDEALLHYHRMLDLIETPGPQWVLGTGYISMWESVHRAEELLLEMEDPAVLAVRGIHEELRLQDLRDASARCLACETTPGRRCSRSWTSNLPDAAAAC